MPLHSCYISQYCSRLINKPFEGKILKPLMLDLIQKFQNWTCTLKLFKQFLYSLKPPTQGVNEGNTSDRIFKP